MNKTTVLKWRYILFLGSIVLTVIASQLIVQYDLDKQNSDAHLINTAGKQRMVGQRIAKLVLYIHNDIYQTGQPFQPRMDTLAKTLKLWVDVHNALIKHNSEGQKSQAIAKLLDANTPNLKVIASACDALLRNPTKSSADSAVKIVVDNDIKFLLMMERTAATYQAEAEKKLAYLKKVELVLALLTIIILLVEVVYIFQPLLRKLLNLNKNLLDANAILVSSEEEIRTNRDQISLLQKKLEIKEKQYRQLVENSMDLITLFDIQGNYIFVSLSVKRMLGYDPEELVGEFGMNFVHPDDRELLIGEPLRKVLKGESVLNPAFRLKKKDGSYVWIEAYTNPVLDEAGKIIALQTTNRDITQRKVVERELIEAKEKAEIALHQADNLLHEKNDLIGLLSHDMRAPINQVQGLAGIMALSLDEKEVLKECLAKMNYALNKQLELFQNVLSMLKADQLSNDAEPAQKVSLQKLINTVKRTLDWELKNKQIELVSDIPTAFTINVQRNFIQAIQNIISNATKFSNSGQTIWVTAQEEGGITTIKIRDNGMGFEAKKAEKLFERFTTEGRRGTNNEPSTGLGLYLVKQIIENHNGSISAHSDGEGKGSVFTIRLKTDL